MYTSTTFHIKKHRAAGRMILFIGLIIPFLIALTSCAEADNLEPARKQANPGQHTPLSKLYKVIINDQNIDDVATFVDENGNTQVALVPILQFMDFHVVEDEETVRAGYTDVMHEVVKGTNTAVSEGEELTLSDPVRAMHGEVFISVPALQQLLGPNSELSIEGQSLLINTFVADENFNLDEDLGDIETTDELTDEPIDIPAVSSRQASRIINTARRFIGTPYQFGARSGQTRTFDCSSFTQYVYGVHNIRLPRNSRQQANLRHTNRAQYVRVSQLRPGDLVFFYWPGRFSSNRTVGHVGIYMGNGRVIHSTPSRGVHIVNAAKSSYWRKTYLGGLRLRG